MDNSWRVGTMPEQWPERPMRPGEAWRAAVSAVVGIGWMIFLIIFLFFFARHYSVYENIAIFLVSILVVGAILAPVWITLGMAYRECPPEERRQRPRRRRRRARAR